MMAPSRQGSRRETQKQPPRSVAERASVEAATELIGASVDSVAFAREPFLVEEAVLLWSKKRVFCQKSPVFASVEAATELIYTHRSTRSPLPVSPLFAEERVVLWSKKLVFCQKSTVF